MKSAAIFAVIAFGASILATPVRASANDVFCTEADSLEVVNENSFTDGIEALEEGCSGTGPNNECSGIEEPAMGADEKKPEESSQSTGENSEHAGICDSSQEEAGDPEDTVMATDKHVTTDNTGSDNLSENSKEPEQDAEMPLLSGDETDDQKRMEKTGLLDDFVEIAEPEKEPVSQTGWKEENGKRYYINENGEYATGFVVINNNFYHFSEDGSMSSGMVENGDEHYLFSEEGSVTPGWNLFNGTRYYVERDGRVASGWAVIEGKKYFFDKDGKTFEGIREVDGKKYCFDLDGAIKTGWVVIGEKRYYFNDDGSASSGIVDIGGKKYLLSAGGYVVPGWNTINGSKCYVRTDGLVLTGWNVVSGSRYFFDADGRLKTGLFAFGGKRYLLSQSGRIVPGLTVLSNRLYYVKNDGQIATGKVKLGNAVYRFDQGGAIASVGWVRTTDGKVYYIDRGGVIHTGWLNLNGKKYYLRSDGTMKTGWLKTGGKLYLMNADGSMYSKTGWLRRGSKYFYVTKDGSMKTGWLNLNGKKYYICSDGTMKTGWLKTGGKLYLMNADGSMYSKTGWLRRGSKYFYVTKDGSMKTGWLNLNGKKYYICSDGTMRTGWLKTGGKLYLMNADGTAKTGWFNGGGNRYYFKKDGSASAGIITINGEKYLFSSGGALMTGINEVNGNIYKSTVNGVITDSINGSHIVAFIYDDGQALSADRENGYSGGNTVKKVYDDNDNAQKWEMIKNADGSYRIRNVYTGLYLQNPGRNKITTTCQTDVKNIDWDIIDIDGEKVFADHRDNTNTLPQKISVSERQVINNVKDILYTDVEKIFNTVISKFRAGDKAGEYTVRCSYTDYLKICQKFNDEFSVYSEYSNFIKSFSMSKGQLVLDLSKGSVMYSQSEATKKAFKAAESACGVKNSMSDWEKIRQINKYICQNYTSVIGGSNMHQMMVKKYGSCVQHTMLFNYLCNKYGVPVKNVSLVSKDGNSRHSLNMAKAGNIWYYCDIMMNNDYGSGKNVDDSYLFMRNLKNAPRNAYERYDITKIVFY